MIYQFLHRTFISALILISALLQPAYASIEIVAKVNGHPITNYDLSQRVNFLAAVTKIKLNDGNRQRIEADALQMLIDEKLKLAAAQEIDANIAERSLAMARKLVDSSFQQNGKNGFEVLRELKLDTASIQQKFVTDLAWASFIQAKFSNKLGDVDAKIDAELARMLEDATKPQIRVSELVLVPEPSRPLQDTLRLANEIVSAVTQGANFNAIAQQYSVAGSAQNGGRLGWLSTSQLPQNISNALAKIDVGAVTPPIQQDGAILLFQKNGERKNGQADPSQDRIWLTRALLPLAVGVANADRLEAAARLEELANHPPVRGWPSDTQLRGLHSATPAPLTFHRSFSDSLKSAASWRFAVLLDVCGVNVFAWYQATPKPALRVRLPAPDAPVTSRWSPPRTSSERSPKSSRLQ